MRIDCEQSLSSPRLNQHKCIIIIMIATQARQAGSLDPPSPQSLLGFTQNVHIFLFISTHMLDMKKKG